MHFLSPDFLFRDAILGGLAVAILCSTLGVYMALRRLVLLSVALPQAGAAGIAAVFLATRHQHQGSGGHLLALAGSLVATLGALAALVLGSRRGRSPAEWRIGALLAIASAATYLFVALDPKGDIEMANLLRGELLAIGDSELAVLAAAGTLTLALFFLFRREILLASFDPEFARTLGRRPERADALLYVLLGGSIALGVMNVGPLVVFGFLVLPALTALRIAPSLGIAFLLSAGVAAASSLGGFAIALGADLPAGPTSVAAAATVWLAVNLAARLRVRARGVRTAALLALLLPLVGGCAALFGAQRPDGPLARGSLPDLEAAQPIAVLGFHNETGDPLLLPSGNPLKDLGRALGDPFAPKPATVPDALQAIAAHELERRGLPIVPTEQVRSLVSEAPSGRVAGVEAAQQAGLTGPVLIGTLRRWTLTRTDLLLVRLELQLVDVASGEVLWKGEAHRPVPIPGALTLQEVLIDATPRIFAEAFGS
jgi:ABC-type Mn2+/Zn2+ transport system permease subunit